MKRVLIGLFLPWVFASQSYAQDLTPQSLFNRCYTQLTGNPVPLNHALMAQVKAGKISAGAACKQILRKGLLGASGELALTKDSEARAVLNNFYNFHRTWFPSNNFDTVQGYDPSETNGTIDVYDATEPALALTYALFGVNQPYSSVLTRSTGVRAMRIQDEVVKTRFAFTANHPGRFLNGKIEMQNAPFTFRNDSESTLRVSRDINTHVAYKLNVPTIMVGELSGIRPTTEKFMVPNISLKPISGDAVNDKGSKVSQYPGLNFKYDLFATHGGGVLGTPIYLMQYLGHPLNMKFNGQTKVARRWSQQNMESFLCASLPALRESDITSMISTTSSAAFRNSSSCVMCHATLDPMAYTARNVTTGAFDYLRVTQNGVATIGSDGKAINPPAAFARNAVAITTYQPTMASVSGWPAEPVADFHRQTPTGRLYFRSMTGELVNKSVTGIAGLGKAMTETDDFYACAAKRYFEFMTGIEVPLYDRSNPRNAALNEALSAEAIEDRRFVEDLAKNLRSSGSLVQMVEEIMNSSYYSKENFR